MMDDLEKEAQEISLMYGEALHRLSSPISIIPETFSPIGQGCFKSIIILLDNSIKFSDGGAVQVTLTKTEANHIQFHYIR
jgi:signal transduction histidine kinase